MAERAEREPNSESGRTFVSVAFVVTATQSLRALALACLTLITACGEEGLFPTTVDPGPDYSIADLVFDEAFFYCQVEPRVMATHRCGPGDPAAGDSSGGCHFNVTAFRLTDYAPPVAAGCQGNIIGSPVPGAARQNYQTSQARMRRDPEVAPLLQRPLQRIEHPRTIFSDDSDAAAAIREWATRVTTQ
jgi:hypothetical protein